MDQILLVLFPIIAFLGVPFLSLLGNFITHELQYLGGFHVLICLVFSHVFFGFYLFYSSILYHKQNQLFIAVTVGMLALIILLTHSIVIPRYGIEGAAWTALFSFLLLCIIVRKRFLTFANSKNNNLLDIITLIVIGALIYGVYISSLMKLPYVVTLLFPICAAAFYYGFIQLTRPNSLSNFSNDLEELIELKSN